ncbi:hypothetical protein NEOLI_003127 [Neolecta irregularis DAH-3]|uniref:MYND-type domain-containing protein n=1 Tax=Neolecta irregularis (strain DAH-3) TaxID=1198029 RepID=A0A1U7LNB8_NEOID|nr:hypothetical protein NEOLI_003127 [Neolecta irregularis DAH-3]|eukprot:OLL24083.1 hypothetical protein NEOLI_003127 [Neolecta irregularis DAH-3]
MSFGFTPRKSADKDPLGWNAEWENYVLEIHQKSQAHPELRPDLTAPTFEAFNSQGSITTTKQMKMDLLRIQNDLRGFVKEKSLGRIKSKWGQIPVSNRKLLLATAIGEVEVIGLNYLVGKRIICPELQVNSLIPTSGFCRILERYIQISSEPIITSNAIVDQFLGLPFSEEYRDEHTGGVMFVDQSLTSRSFYITLFLLLALHRLYGQKLPVPVFQNLEAIENDDVEIKKFMETLGPDQREKFQEYMEQYAANNKKKCLVCQKTDVKLMDCGRCKEASGVSTSYCSKECQKKDWSAHRVACGKPANASVD